MASALHIIPINTTDAIIAASLGYLSLKGIAVVYAWLRGHEGLGGGDPKLLAALGAWLGWQALPLLMCMAALSGTLVAVGLILTGRIHKHQAIAFGPYLAIAGWLMMMYPQLNTLVIH